MLIMVQFTRVSLCVISCILSVLAAGKGAYDHRALTGVISRDFVTQYHVIRAVLSGVDAQFVLPFVLPRNEDLYTYFLCLLY